ncbi:MAG: PAS domain-containing protein [Bacteroidetes bacterium]|nr:PAS domain-containing protein [Bacteroidota bacterium]
MYIIRNEQGNPIKFQGIALDITKRKLHEQEIRDSNERFKLLAKATIEAVIDWDIENNTTFWGEGFQTMLGYDLEMCDEDFWQRNIHPTDRKRVLRDLKKAIARPETQFFDAEYQFFRANGSIAHVQHKGILVRNAAGKAVRAIGAMIDMTETLDRMQKIESQNKALKDIAWTQSHVVRRPLVNMLGFINLLRNNVEIDKESENLLKYLSISAEELDKITREIVKKTSEINNL